MTPTPAHTTHLYQGKALDASAQWYPFGSRWYDARLGLWNATDPAHQMASPYTAMGGNPVRKGHDVAYIPIRCIEPRS